MSTSVEQSTASQTKESQSRRKSLILYALPAIILFVVFAIVPMVGVFVLSFTKWNGIGAIEFAGLQSWIETFDRPTTWQGIWLTLRIIILSWLAQTPLSILLGAFLAGQEKYRNVLAIFYFVPLLLSSAAIAIIYKTLLDPYFGLGAGLGVDWLRQNWLGDTTLVWGVLIFIIAWQFIPFHTLIYQGGVRQIPVTLYEAAEIDGAGRVRQFFSITLPQLKYTIITSSTLMAVGALTYFDIIFVLTGGGPGTATRILPLDMYITGFRSNEMGQASVLAVLLVLFGLGLALGIQRLGGKDDSSSQLEGAM